MKPPTRPDAERVWLAFAQSALGGVASVDAAIDRESGQAWADVNAALADDAAELADLMLERWRLRYDDAKPEATKSAGPPAPDW